MKKLKHDRDYETALMNGREWVKSLNPKKKKAPAQTDANFVKEVKQLVKDNPDIELALSKAGEKEGEE